MKNDYIGEMSEAMTNEKALQGFEEYCETCRKNCEEAGAELVCNCCKVKRAKEAIEKQIPKKPTVIDHWHFCPSCYEKYGFTYDILVGMRGSKTDKCYCLSCGQVIEMTTR